MDTTHTTQTIYNALLEKFSELPVIRQAKKQLVEQENSEAIKGRKLCLAGLKARREIEKQTHADLEAAKATLPAMQEKLERVLANIASAHNAHAQANSQRQTVERSLITDHGEGVILRTLYMIDLLRKHAQKQIEILSDPMNSAIYVDGKLVGFREADLDQTKRKADLERDLKTLDDLFKQAQQLVEADLSPATIKSKCDALLATTGYQADTNYQ
jgi:hypothetical protein